MMLSTLLRASVDGAVIVAVAWLLCQMLPRLSPAARTILWWCAATKFVLALVWIAPVQVPILPPTESAVASTAISVVRAPLELVPAIADVLPRSADARDRGLWSAAVAGIWILGVALAVAIGLRRWRTTRDVVKESQAAPDRIRDVAADLAARLAIRRMPDVRMSAHVDAPVVTGFLKPVVILPIDRFPALTDRQQHMALCHELTHIKRADLRLGCLPALAERMFFFHPLAHLAAREYALWREAACDAAVLKTLDVSPAEYGQFLIGLGVAGRRTGLVAAGTSWSFANLKRRLVMLRHPSTTSTTSQVAAAGAFAVAIAAMVPVQLTARPAPTVHPPITTTRAPAVLVPSEPTPSEAMTPGTVAGDRGLSQEASPQPARTKKQELTYVLFLDDTHTTTSASPGDVERARTFKRPGEPLLWVRDRGAEYVVRDPAVLREVEEMWKSVDRIGEQQGQLGLEEGKLAEMLAQGAQKQAEMDAAQSALARDQGELSRLLTAAEKLEAQRHLEEVAKAKDSKVEQLNNIERQRRELEQRTKELQTMAFYLENLELSQKMARLQKSMVDADLKMKLSVFKTEARMRTLIDRAIATGAAQVVK